MTLAVASAVLATATASPAQANVYTVRACDAAEGVNNSWAVLPSSSRGVVAYTACPSGGSRRRGLAAHNVIGGRHGRPTSVKRGTHAGLIFTAPAGTTIVGIRAGYYLYRHDPRWRAGIWNGLRLVRGCGRGHAGCDRAAADRYIPIPHASSVAVAVVCAASSCPTTSSGDRTRGGVQVSASLYSATVSLADDSQPTLADAGGPLWTDGWHSGAQAVGFNASDNSGVSDARVVADDRVLDDKANPCDFTRSVPCPEGGAQFGVDTSLIKPDGPHTLSLEARDAAGNVASVSRRVLIDNTPPAPPEELSVDGGYGWRRSNSFTVRWRNPPDDGGAPIAAAVYEICPAAGGPCQTQERAEAGIHSLDGVTVPAAGDWILRAWLRDAAGNADRRTAADPVDLRWDDEAPAAAFLPQDPNDPTRVAVQVSDQVSGVASGVIEMKKSDAKAWLPLDTTLTGGELRATVDDAHLPDGVYQLRARALDQAGNETSSSTRTDGSAATVTLPLRLETRLRAGAVAQRHGRKRSRRLRAVAHVRFGHRVHLAGQLTSGDGTPIANAPVLVFQRADGPGSAWTPVASLTTSAKGVFNYAAPAGVSRAIRFYYAGTPTIRAAERDVILGVGAQTTFRVNRHSVRNGRAVRFSGQLAGGGVPAGGKLLELQVRLRGTWRTFATLHTDARGTWHYAYRFVASRGRLVYLFRAHVPREATYPYADGSSHRAKVTVSG